MKTKIIYFCCFTVINLRLFAQNDSLALLNRINDIIAYNTTIPAKKVNSLLIGVIEGEKIYRYSLRYGLEEPCLDWNSTLFLGGASKLFTLMTIRENETVSLGNQVGFDSLEIDQIVSHKAGYERIPIFKRGPNEMKAYYESFEEMELLDKSVPNIEKSGKFIYSHWGYCCLEAKLNKQGYTHLSNLYTGTNLGFPYQVRSYNGSVGLLCQGYIRDNLRAKAPEFKSCIGTLGLIIPANDLLKFVYHNSHFDASNSNYPWLKPLFRNPSKTGIRKSIEKCDGWYKLTEVSGRTIYGYAGSIAGYSLSLCFDLKAKNGVLVAANSSESLDQLGLLILKNLDNTKPDGKSQEKN